MCRSVEIPEFVAYSSATPYGAAWTAVIVLSGLQNFKPRGAGRRCYAGAMSAAVAIRLSLPEARSWRLALRFVHLAAASLALLAGGAAPVAGGLLAGALVLHLCWLEARHRALAASLLGVLFDSTGVWHLQWRDGTRDRARLAPGPVVSPWLTILTLDGPRGRIGLFVTPDMLDADSFRRLRMRLLWQGAATDATLVGSPSARAARSRAS